MCMNAYVYTFQEAARRCGKEFVGRPEDKSLKAYNIGLLEQGTVKAEVLEETNETSKGLDSPSLAYDDQLPLNGDLATSKTCYIPCLLRMAYMLCQVNMN